MLSFFFPLTTSIGYRWVLWSTDRSRKTSSPVSLLKLKWHWSSLLEKNVGGRTTSLWAWPPNLAIWVGVGPCSVAVLGMVDDLFSNFVAGDEIEDGVWRLHCRAHAMFGARQSKSKSKSKNQKGKSKIKSKSKGKRKGKRKGT